MPVFVELQFATCSLPNYLFHGRIKLVNTDVEQAPSDQELLTTSTTVANYPYRRSLANLKLTEKCVVQDLEYWLTLPMECPSLV